MYIIKKHYEATEKNINRLNEIIDFYEGKKGHILSKNSFPIRWEIETFGYKNRSGAMKGLKVAQNFAEWETKDGFWNVSVELVEV